MEMMTANEQAREIMKDIERDNGMAYREALSRKSATAGCVSNDVFEFQESGWCNHANPKICPHALKVQKTKKHEVQSWACELAI